MPLPSPFLMKVGNFTMPLSSSSKAVTGVGFKPKAVVLFSAGNDTAGAWHGATTSADLTGLTVSMFTADGESAALYESSDDGGSAVRHGLHQKAFRVEDSGGLQTGQATLASMDSDGFTLQWADVVGDYAFIVGYIALGGDSLVANVVKWHMAPFFGTGEVSVTKVGFKPDVVLHLCGDDQLFTPFDIENWPDGSFSDNGQALFHMGAME